jgi:type II secretory pathway component PulJ
LTGWLHRWRADDGFTVVELTLAMALMIVVMSATLSVLDIFASTTQRNRTLASEVDDARIAMDQLAHELRNATAYTTTANPSQGALLRASAFDIVIKEVDPVGSSTSANQYAVESVRYCLDTTGNVLYRQTTSGAVTPTTACPDTTWTTSPLARDISNGTSRPPFTYDATTLASIGAVKMTLYVNTSPGQRPGETQLNSGVFLRNATLPPTASFTAVAEQNLHVALNGSASSDPSGHLLTFSWQDGATVLPQATPTVDYVAPTAGAHTFTLTVTDTAGLTATTSQTVTVQ